MLAEGARIGRYRVIALVGAGGMGEVYRAHDEGIDRDVALKVLPPEWSGDGERFRRFTQEARAAGALNHPNVLTVHDAGVHDGAPYLVTELLEGETLRARLETGAVTIPEAVEVATQIAKGLSAAHEKGIVHRDLKPDNVFVTRDGTVKILDFGLAKLVGETAASEELTVAPTEALPTRTGAVLGTLGYMAPEQVRGLPVDHRADIFAFGCLLYEILSGQKAFKGDTAADMTAAILGQEAPPSPAHVVEVAPALERIVRRCLAKRPEDRFQSTRDLAHDVGTVLGESNLRQATAGAGVATRRRVVALATVGAALLGTVAMVAVKLGLVSRGPRKAAVPRIVVLPFENLGSPDDAYFTAGMAEEITSRLANVQRLGVISRTTAMGYDSKGKTVKQIGADLGVDYVLEGSVRWEHGLGHDSRVRITPQLIRVADDTHVWSGRYDRVLADVFAMQSDVAESTVRAMGVALLPREKTALKEVSTNDLEAYDLYLRGRELAARSDARADVEGAIRAFEAAADRDPRFAQALAGLARNCLRMHFLYRDQSQDWLGRARDAAQKAVELRPDLSETHNALGWYFYQGEGDYAEGLRELTTARTIQPGNSDALLGIGSVLRRQGRWAEAAEAMGAALELDSNNGTVLVNTGATLILARRYAEADRVFATAIALNPRIGGPYGYRAWLQLVWHGDLDRAQAVLDEAAGVAEMSDDQAHLADRRFFVTLCRRDYQGALRQLEKETRRALSNQMAYEPIPLLAGEVQLLAGRADLARRSFEAARVELEQEITRAPDDARLHSALGLADAGLGERSDAVREADRSCALADAANDAWVALRQLENRAWVYSLVGRADEAVAQLGELLARGGSLTPQVLRLDPRWDSLRGNPRFQGLLAKYAVKE